MKPLLLHPINWNDYALIDSGNGNKLERFGSYLFSRPEPQALWSPRLPFNEWNKSAGSFEMDLTDRAPNELLKESF